MTLFKPHDYQKDGIAHALSVPGCGIFADPGLGKTGMTLYYQSCLRMAAPGIKTLLVAPLRVCQWVWEAEIKNFSNFGHLTYRFLWGKNKDALLNLPLSDITAVTPEGLKWLWKRVGDSHPFRSLVVDESSRFKAPFIVKPPGYKGNLLRIKNPSAMRYLLKLAKTIPRRVILTGTPVPNSLADIFSQMLIVDRGESLSPYCDKFMYRYFKKTHKFADWVLKHGSAEKIQEAVAPRIFTISAVKYISIPEVKINDIFVELDEKSREIYEAAEDSLFANLEGLISGVPGKRTPYMLCLQIASGGYYIYEWDGEGEEPIKNGYETLHDSKIKVLESLQCELAGKPILAAWKFKFTLDQMVKSEFRYEEIKSKGVIDRWNAGKVEALVGHPKSVGHGLNLQKGPCKDVVWVTLTDVPELYTQFNARIVRQGSSQEKVTIHRIIARDTIEEVVVRRMEKKNCTEREFLKMLEEYRERKTSISNSRQSRPR